MNGLRCAYLAALCGLAILAAGCAGLTGGGLGPGRGQFSSEWVEIVMGGLMGDSEEGLVLSLSLKNKSQQPLWVTVDFRAPEPGQPCQVTERIDVGGTERYTCAQSLVVAEQDYPIHIEVYGDESQTALLESPQTKFWFGKSDAAAFEANVERLKKSSP